MKKILCLFLAIGLTIGNSTFVFGEYNSGNDYSQVRQEAMQTSIGKKYIPTLEEILPDLSSEKLEEISARVQSINTTEINRDMNIFLWFIEDFINHELRSRVLDINPVFSAEEKSIADNEISKLQNTLSEEVISFIENVFMSYNSMSSYRESGDFEMDVHMNISDFLDYSFNLEIEDYISQIESLDQSFAGDVTMDFNMQSYYGDEIGVNGSSSVDLIVKDGVYYLKMDNTMINLSEAIPEALENFVNSLNTLGKENTYIKFEDTQTKQIFAFIESILQTSPEELVKTISSKKLFEAYDMTENGYLIRPTREMCSILKQSSSIIFGFIQPECSESQYEDMIEEMISGGMSIHMELGDTNTLTLSINNEYVDSDISLEYTQYGIISLSGYILEPGNADVNNIEFSYLPKDSFYLNMNIEEEFESNLEIDFRKDNSVKSIEYIGRIYNDNEEIIIDGKLLAGEFDFSVNGKMRGDEIDCKFEGSLRKYNGDIEGACSILDTNTWSDEISQLYWEVMGKYDFSSNKNDIFLEMMASQDGENTFDMSIKNIGKKQAGIKNAIPIPKKIISQGDFEAMVGESFFNTNSLFYGSGDSSWDSNYTIETNDYEDYSETCYNYDSGDSTCYQYYDTKSITCYYIAETNSETCDEYDYGYEIVEKEFDEYTQTCYNYNSGDILCYNQYETYSETCSDYSASGGEVYCSEQHDDYYYDGLYDIYYYDTYQIDGKTGERTDY